MILKVPPKEALTILHNLIKNGDKCYDSISEVYEAIPFLLEEEKAKRQSMKALKENEAEDARKRKEEEEEERRRKEKEALAEPKHLATEGSRTPQGVQIDIDFDNLPERSSNDKVQFAQKMKQDWERTWSEQKKNMERGGKITEALKEHMEQVKRSFSWLENSNSVMVSALAGLSEGISKEAKTLGKIGMESPLFQELAIQREEEELMPLKEQDEFYTSHLEALRRMKKEWVDEAWNAINHISGNNYVYLMQFDEARGEWYQGSYDHLYDSTPFGLTRRTANNLYPEYINLRRNLKAKIDFLQVLYKEIEPLVADPLSYIPERHLISYYNRVIPLRSDSAQALVCEYMFDFPYGTKVEMAELDAHLKNKNVEDIETFDRTKIDSAVNSLNIKSKETFGFKLFKREGATISVSFKQ